jgi:hypothetical protein
MTATYTANWTTERPTEPGLYWFYGFTNNDHKRPNGQPRWHLCEMMPISSGLLMKVGGVFGWDRDPMVGHYCKTILPQLPVDACTSNVP